MHDATALFVWGFVVHLVADWLFQTEWMAIHKMDLRHLAAWVHSGIHTAGLLLVFAWPLALLIGLSHLLIDTRKPLSWWLRMVKHIPKAANHQSVEIWVDQVMHITVLAIAALGAELLSFW
jgi:hypothetical protein